MTLQDSNRKRSESLVQLAKEPANERPEFFKIKGPGKGTETQEVIQHLTSQVKARVSISLEIHADIPDGVDEQVERTVLENCRTLKFEPFGFEKE